MLQGQKTRDQLEKSHKPFKGRWAGSTRGRRLNRRYNRVSQHEEEGTH